MDFYPPFRRIVAASLVALLAGCSAQADALHNATGANPAAQGTLVAFGPGKIQHIVIIVQENRTPDNLFNGFPGADTVKSGVNSHGVTVPLRPINLKDRYDLDHSHKGFLTEYAGGAMNGFDLEKSAKCPIKCRPKDIRAYSFVPKNQVLPYWQMAQQYTFADRMFQSNQGPSFPAHQFILSGTSLTSVTSPLLAAENPITPLHKTTGGCDSPPGSLVGLIDPATGVEGAKMYPCFDHPTLIDRLDAAHVSWKYYQPVITSGLWYAPDAIRHLRYSSAYANVVAPNTAVIAAAKGGTLPAVSWVIPTAAESDHAAIDNGTGPSWVTSVVNAIGTSKYWNSTAIIITWDDWGGWYDHVKPPIYNHYEDGFRVPLIIVSPYARRGYVSHVQHEFGSILKFVETTFGLPPVGYTDVRSDNLSDCFNFWQPPTVFHPISAPIPLAYFEKLPATSVSPDDDSI